jgi:CBS domain-containing protein
MPQVRELMTKDPRTIRPDATAVDAARLMRDEDAGVAPIAEDDRLVGVVTDRDIAIRVVAEAKDPGSTKVTEIASQNVVTIDPQQDLDEALRLMANHQVRRLPVVEEDGKLVGILAQADVARHAEPARTGKVVEEISE